MGDSWNIMLNVETDFENIGEEMSEKIHSFISEIQEY